MAFTAHHTQIGEQPFWYQLDPWRDLERATRRARHYSLDHGGYTCVKDADGRVVFGTDPAELDRAIAAGTNTHFRQVSTGSA